MIEMRVMGIAVDTRTGNPIVVLNDKEKRRALPIWIGSAEASSIIRRIENIKVARPMTHDLIVEIIEKMGFSVDRIEINDVEEETYFAVIVIDDGKGNEQSVDARPSDAIAVALRTNSPIFVSEKVLATGSVTCDEEKDEEEAGEFRNFIQSIKPSDFDKIMKEREGE